MILLRYIFLLIALVGFTSPLFCQDKKVEGIVFDKNTKQRIGNVKLANLRTGEVNYNTIKGEFVFNAQLGDHIVAICKGYFSDTLQVDNRGLLLFHLVRESFYIDEVQVFARKTPEEILKKAKEDYEKAYRLAGYGDVFSVGPNGAGLSINSIYSLFSKEAKRARRLTKTIENDYKENVIDYKFTKELISKITGLNSEEAERFRRIFRPSYFFILSASDYELVNYIKDCYSRYQLNPSQYFIEPFPTINYKLVP
ncbi:hypothetical protein K2F45_27245 [Sphingobacterium siyangense]|uniref:Carboxypeptidase-like regulatory domain-containing protein n=1 Tax=Sphingobacterium paramultivorum TaxID=2886510 RepID=A0A7G5E7H2_9SPHI|nr:hypothetical protein BV902_01120 [Sphingobacterium sp. B29]MBB1647868.1 hypothetical protein [Sphingobacterium sp. UME9]QMV69947.1 hypothetical protein HS960_20795 [Sphingobacterium paramultivorum]UQA75402.1 hypothetical protein K2F45_27245 [Sphingobacterium siyangense]